MNILYLNRGMEMGGVEKCIIQLSKLFRSNNKIIVASMGGELVRELEKININHYDIINTDSKSPLDILKNLNIILRIVKREKIDIIHSHHRMTTLLAKVVSKFIKVKVIHTQHLCIEDKHRLTNLALKNIDTIAVSEAAKRILVERSSLDEKKITTIYNTIETECKNNSVDNILLSLKKEGYFIAAQVSRVVDYKGVYDFIEIAKKTSLENEKIKFVLLGDGPELNNLKKIVKDEKLEEKIYLLGAKDNIIEHLKYVDVLLLCSYIEGLPLTPLEAFSQGVPVIGTNINGTNEEIDNEYNGYLVEVKDVEGFKNNILKLYNDKTLYISMKDNCKRTFREKFNKNIYLNSHMSMYNTLE
ncbi:glycosyltransferase family 4 protein [Clostridium magnum]|uniref:N, N'-diacetylbacillosaminyl-diphospho-undecaprenol alpha-1,3-N-acetylgalactosaminyltransferase n=1 Tax=Clostridium magnum DSM 2767 TaxID=1121326 RepID=A0A161YHK5_9CLOT|nr:glycosyltransferase family 4 protein [Clostridium magnum]KZL89752.1 N,N'-diacetylbacillosaminyl-diphospho-undecaprenol alpha-1,3-N-acetylgalactosaminyltransferase [Clostridium magnum DSM 2767]SHH65776.1 Glycosyltransferase involved in cell wall bisynthesis [Clostridium magnum DSM 2767]